MRIEIQNFSFEFRIECNNKDLDMDIYIGNNVCIGNTTLEHQAVISQPYSMLLLCFEYFYPREYCVLIQHVCLNIRIELSRFFVLGIYITRNLGLRILKSIALSSNTLVCEFNTLLIQYMKHMILMSFEVDILDLSHAKDGPISIYRFFLLAPSTSSKVSRCSEPILSILEARNYQLGLNPENMADKGAIPSPIH